LAGSAAESGAELLRIALLRTSDPQGTATDVETAVYLSITRGNTVPPGPYGG
jgi:hypothetical protein